jgi:hypothetical protein
MINKEVLEIYIQEDKEIRDLLVSQGIIDNHRVVRCGKWSNKEGFPNKPYPTFCKRYGCRVCRRELIDTQRKKHYSNNIQFINRGGQVLLLTLTIPHTVKDKLCTLYESFQKSVGNMKVSRGWRKIKEITNYQFHYNNIELTEEDNGYHLHSHITYGIMNDVSLLTIEDILFDTWSKETLKMGFGKVSRKCIKVSIPYSLTYGDKSIEELSEIEGTLEWWESKFKEKFESPSSQFRTRKLKEISSEIKTINTTFWGKLKRGRIWTSELSLINTSESRKGI